MTTTTRTERDQETRPTSTAEPVEHYEVVDGQIVDEPPLGARDGWITSEIGEALVIFNAGKQLGKKYEEMLFILADEPRLRRRPDLAFVTAERWPGDKPAPSSAGWNVIPDLAVEVIGPTDPIEDLMNKIEDYFQAGVWVVHPSVQKLHAYDSPKSVQILDAEDMLVGGAVLPGFEMPLRRIFVRDDIEPTLPVL